MSSYTASQSLYIIFIVFQVKVRSGMGKCRRHLMNLNMTEVRLAGS